MTFVLVTIKVKIGELQFSVTHFLTIYIRRGGRMKARNSDWYKNGWTLDIKNESWVEDTENQVAFIIKTLGLTGGVIAGI